MTNDSVGRPRAFNTIVYGGVAVGVLDISDAITFYGLHNHLPPVRIFQSVAAGLIGRPAAINGGIKTAVLGGFLHFFIAFCVAAAFYIAARLVPLLIKHAVICGMIYGVIVNFIMSYVVVPLSAIGPRTAPMPWAVFANGVIGHALLVGLPVALIARHSAKSNSGS